MNQICIPKISNSECSFAWTPNPPGSSVYIYADEYNEDDDNLMMMMTETVLWLQKGRYLIDAMEWGQRESFSYIVPPYALGIVNTLWEWNSEYRKKNFSNLWMNAF